MSYIWHTCWDIFTFQLHSKKEQTGNKARGALAGFEEFLSRRIERQFLFIFLFALFLTAKSGKKHLGGLFLSIWSWHSEPNRNPCPSNPVAKLAANDFPRHIHVWVELGRTRWKPNLPSFSSFAVPLVLSLISTNCCSASFSGLWLWSAR